MQGLINDFFQSLAHLIIFLNNKRFLLWFLLYFTYMPTFYQLFLFTAIRSKVSVKLIKQVKSA